CSALELQRGADDPRFTTKADRVRNREELISILSDNIARRDINELRSLLDEKGIPNAPVQRIDQVVEDPQTLAVGILQSECEGTPTVVGLPLKFDKRRPAYGSPAPDLGECHDPSLYAPTMAKQAHE